MTNLKLLLSHIYYNHYPPFKIILTPTLPINIKFNFILNHTLFKLFPKTYFIKHNIPHQLYNPK